MMRKEVPFEDLRTSDLYVDCLYKGGPINQSGEVLSKLIPGCSNSGGFRKVLCRNDKSKIAYVVLFTTMNELEWPDYLDPQTGVFRYYGDNRKAGQDIHETSRRGNQLLRDTFALLNQGQQASIPPFLVFKKGDKGKDVQFLGLAAPGVTSLSPDKELVAFWRTYQGRRFQNYEAYFTILDTGATPIPRAWLEALWSDDVSEATSLEPLVWKMFRYQGRQGIQPLKAKAIEVFPGWQSQLQADHEGQECLRLIREFYKGRAHEFELCATDILMKLDPNFVDFQITRPWRDGGRDAIGFYQIQSPGAVHSNLRIDCALEAKCYNPTTSKLGQAGNSVGVREMSRLISRIRYRQFGVMLTTSFINKQAYEEVKADGHPILMITATNIASVLYEHGIHSGDVDSWLESLENRYPRMA